MKTTATPQRGPSDRTIYALLFVITVAVYSQVHNFAFLSFDDNQGLLGNPRVRDGFSWSGIAWAFTSAFASNWFPLTWLSHMLDFQLFGMDAGWHHLTNVLIHAISPVLLFALMKRMTGKLWESAFVAFVFSLHPLHVESVAWISERKDVLFAFFWFLTTWLYLDFVAQKTLRRYLLMTLAFCFGLMSKQMIVTLPFTLLLFDAWPLKRTGWKTLVLEKVPLVALSAAASAIAFLAQRKGGAVQSIDSIPLAARVANSAVAYAAYLGNFFWPQGLAAYYPYRQWPAADVAMAAAILAGISILVAIAWRKRPYLAVGWFWYLGTLVPVIGLVQVGRQARADRYTYIPLIGISIMAAWAASEAIERWPRSKSALTGLAAIVCACWLFVTWVQIDYWKDGLTLYRRALAVTEGNYVMHENLGVDLAGRGQNQEALRELYKSLEENSDQPRVHNSLGTVLYNLGRKQDAVEEFQQTLRSEPGNAVAHSNLGNVLVEIGRADDAIRELNEALRLNPNLETTYFGLGMVLVKQNRPDDAAAYFSQALRINPNFPQAREQLQALRRPR